MQSTVYKQEYILKYAQTLAKLSALMEKDAYAAFNFNTYSNMYAPSKDSRYFLIPEDNKELQAYKHDPEQEKKYLDKLTKLDERIAYRQKQFDAIPRSSDVSWWKKPFVWGDTWIRGALLDSAKNERNRVAVKENPAYRVRESLARQMAGQAFRGGLTAQEYREWRRLHPNARAIRGTASGTSAYDTAYQQLITLLPENIHELAPQYNA